MNQLERLNQILDEQVRSMHAQSFSGSDQAGTVDVTLDGQFKLVGLEIEDGLLRMGAETVEQRINEALLNARTNAFGDVSAEQTQLIDSLSEMADEMVETVNAQLARMAETGLLPRQAE